MKPADMGTYGFEPFCHRLDNEQPLAFIACLASPSIYRTDARNDADAGGLSGIDQGGGNTVSQVSAIGGSQNKNRIHTLESRTKRLHPTAVAQYHALGKQKSILSRIRTTMARHQKRVSHAKEAFYIICIVIVMLIGLFAYMGPGGYLEIKRMQGELATHQSRVDALQKSKQEHQNAINGLADTRKNNEAIETLAREKGYGKKGEIVQEVPQAEKDRTQIKK